MGEVQGLSDGPNQMRGKRLARLPRPGPRCAASPGRINASAPSGDCRYWGPAQKARVQHGCPRAFLFLLGRLGVLEQPSGDCGSPPGCLLLAVGVDPMQGECESLVAIPRAHSAAQLSGVSHQRPMANCYAAFPECTLTRQNTSRPRRLPIERMPDSHPCRPDLCPAR